MYIFHLEKPSVLQFLGSFKNAELLGLMPSKKQNMIHSVKVFWKDLKQNLVSRNF